MRIYENENPYRKSCESLEFIKFREEVYVSSFRIKILMIEHFVRINILLLIEQLITEHPLAWSVYGFWHFASCIVVWLSSYHHASHSRQVLVVLRVIRKIVKSGELRLPCEWLLSFIASPTASSIKFSHPSLIIRSESLWERQNRWRNLIKFKIHREMKLSERLRARYFTSLNKSFCCVRLFILHMLWIWKLTFS